MWDQYVGLNKKYLFPCDFPSFQKKKCRRVAPTDNCDSAQ